MYDYKNGTMEFRKHIQTHDEHGEFDEGTPLMLVPNEFCLP